MSTILVTGGAGFIGSSFLNLFVPRRPDLRFVNADKLTYAANLESLKEVARAPNYVLEQVDIADTKALRAVFDRHAPAHVIHFAAESHVDRSIASPDGFIQTNIVGTFNLLEVCRQAWRDSERHVFHHVSTDEVFGSLGPTGEFDETSRYDPSSPYSASKAASDHLARAYQRTFGLPIVITNCSNNYGPRQFPEKLIPLMILNALERKPLPVYGTGQNVRDWLFVDDHCEAIWMAFERGRIGETYLVGGRQTLANLDVVKTICRIVADCTRGSLAAIEELIRFVPDRPGHDLRYAIDPTKVERELGWHPRETFETGLRKTVQWYIDNPDWVSSVRTGAYRDWLQLNYDRRK